MVAIRGYRQSEYWELTRVLLEILEDQLFGFLEPTERPRMSQDEARINRFNC